MKRTLCSRTFSLAMLFLTVFTVGLLLFFNHNSAFARSTVANRTINNAWLFILYDDGELVIRLKDADTSGGLDKNYTSKADWDNVWKKAYNDNTDIRPMVKKVSFTLNAKKAKFSFKGLKADSMFEGFTNVTEFDFSGLDASSAVSLQNFFKDDTSLTSIDVSSFGVLPNIINMDGFFAGCSNLEEINIDNLDNSNIGPTNQKHSITPGQSGYVSEDVAREIGAKEYGRELFGKGVYDIPSAFPKLKKISALNSNVWFCKNKQGTPGEEYYNVAENGAALFLANRKMTLNGVEINYARDWLDVITDRDTDSAPSLAGTSEIADKGTNVNVLNNLNTLSAGHLAPGVYEISDDPFDEIPSVETPDTYYAIHYMGQVRPIVELVDDHGGDIILTKGNENLHYLTTKNMTKAEWGTGEKTIPFTATITYPDAAIDVNGKKHDVVITIKSVTFTNLDAIQTYADYNGQRAHDDNNFWDSLAVERKNNNSQEHPFYRTILQATKDQGLILQNYARVGDPTSPWNYTKILSSNSGTTIDFDVKIDKANPDTSFVFYVDDLDVAASQDWLRPNNDADYDNLPIENITYGLGGESIELVSGVNIGDVKFADKTGLTTSGNTVISTGSDPSTPWSEFKVAAKADGNGSTFKWITGISCSSFVLLNTDPAPLSNIAFEPIKKILQGDTLQDGQFDFTLTPDSSVADNKATGNPLTKPNDAAGNVDFGFVFNDPQITIDGDDYYPGTNDNSTQAQNTHGGGTHNKYTYAWEISETDGGDPMIDYDLGPKKLKIVISTPENDTEMKKGIKAEIYVDDTLVDTVWSKDVENNKHTASVKFINTALREVTLKANWEDDSDAKKLRPDDLTGFLTYAYDTPDGAKTGTVRTTAGDWTFDGNSWTTIFKLPRDAFVTAWGQDSVPAKYTFVGTSSSVDADIYEFTNKLTPEKPTIIVPTDNSTPITPTVPTTGLTPAQSTSVTIASFAFGLLVSNILLYFIRRHV